MIRMREQEYSEGMFHRFSVHHIKGCVMSVCLAAGDVNFNRLIKWFSGLLTAKMPSFYGSSNLSHPILST